MLVVKWTEISFGLSSCGFFVVVVWFSDNQVGGESEETKVEELQADQTNKPNNGVDGYKIYHN